MKSATTPTMLAFTIVIVASCFHSAHSTLSPAASAAKPSTEVVAGHPHPQRTATIDETLNPSPPPTVTVTLTGLDNRKRPIRTGLNGTEPPSVFQPCRMDGMVHDPPLQCLLFTLCIPGTIKANNITGTTYQGANELNECTQFDDACCVPDFDRIGAFLRTNSTLEQTLKEAHEQHAM